jgi:tetratricopeptide (TPR) repeat protein
MRHYRLRQSQVEHQRERYNNAIEILDKLNGDSECELALLAMVRRGLITSHTLGGNVQKAIDDGEKWISWLEPLIQNSHDEITSQSLSKELGALYSQLGQAYRKQNRSLTARDYYEKALKLYDQFANAAKAEIASTKINLAFVYHELGRFSEALAQCRAALWINEKLGDPYQLGRSHNVLGIIYDGVLREDDARGHFEKALQYFEEAKSKRGQAMARIAYGRMLRQKQLYNEKRERTIIDLSERLYSEAEEMLDRAITDLRETEVDPSLLAVALNEKATLFRQQKKLDESLKLFNESSDIAYETMNRYRLADNLQDIAIVYYLKGEFDLALESANKAIQEAADDHPHISGRARRTIASVLYDRGDIEGAFSAISDSCIEIVRVDPECFTDSFTRKERLLEEWLDWVKDLIDRLPTTEMKNRKIEQLIQRWHEGEIDGKPLITIHPGFIETLKAISLTE